uniref:Uncharacterized protein n=1 Tax=Hippocampus comes TaxID=109280 RepID=A0A3Q2XLM8_HIPCM
GGEATVCLATSLEPSLLRGSVHHGFFQTYKKNKKIYFFFTYTWSTVLYMLLYVARCCFAASRGPFLTKRYLGGLCCPAGFDGNVALQSTLETDFV